MPYYIRANIIPRLHCHQRLTRFTNDAESAAQRQIEEGGNRAPPRNQFNCGWSWRDISSDGFESTPHWFTVKHEIPPQFRVVDMFLYFSLLGMVSPPDGHEV